MEPKRITLFAGHYGSGKTNIAVNYAFYLKSLDLPVLIADLDIVNPYFRTTDSKLDFEKRGIELISSPYTNSNIDIPAIPAEMYRTVQDKSKYAIIDVGGDDQGAVALGRYVPFIIEEDNYEMFFVANCYRPLTPTAEDALEVMREIEAACKLKFTAIINNSNIGNETTSKDVLDSMQFAHKLSEISALPLFFTTVTDSLHNELKDKIENIFPLKLQEKYFDIKNGGN